MQLLPVQTIHVGRCEVVVFVLVPRNVLKEVASDELCDGGILEAVVATRLTRVSLAAFTDRVVTGHVRAAWLCNIT